MPYLYVWASEQAGLAGDLGSTSKMFASADSIKSFLLVMFSFLLTEIESADYVSAGHVLVPADRDRIC
ncbi:hypothetical protein Tco_0826381 [Tanacetum coccineum]